MITLRRTTAADPDFHSLVAELDIVLREIYGGKQDQYDALNKGLDNACVVVALQDGVPAGCGCFKRINRPDAVEIKRMYVRSAVRRTGIAQALLTELEQWAQDLGYPATVLQTGNKQPEAIELYRKTGYRTISPYGSYADDPDSVCMEKALSRG
ncbi:GNAT family N-acetyltransferase [Tellurirhabdus rosea]|uniref:GNAT family N-acetyltransferase n=1 Tax=Tellurirhabdus rosea TaxID=2674997 RepID=UPI00225C27F3|nr:GNAT family N-acetyltransferase [Tellurirhabdus rosea]